ncbi:1-aminocyclopropane-1-carboxylate synthase, partial [Cymbomonas tetramitiformis]
EAPVPHMSVEQLEELAGQLHTRKTNSIFEFAQLLGSSGVHAVAQDAINIWIDMRPFLDSPDFESEANTWRVLHETYCVLLVPGSTCGVEEPGWFRCSIAGILPTHQPAGAFWQSGPPSPSSSDDEAEDSD